MSNGESCIAAWLEQQKAHERGACCDSPNQCLGSTPSDDGLLPAVGTPDSKTSSSFCRYSTNATHALFAHFYIFYSLTSLYKSACLVTSPGHVLL